MPLVEAEADGCQDQDEGGHSKKSQDKHQEVHKLQRLEEIKSRLNSRRRLETGFLAPVGGREGGGGGKEKEGES